MTSNPFAAELERRRAAKSAIRTPEQRLQALELFSVSMDGHRLEKLRQISAPLAAWIERKHEANLEAKARAWEERTAREAERQTRTSESLKPDVEPSTGNHRRSELEVMHESQRAAMNAAPADNIQNIAQHIANFEVSPSVDKGRRQTSGAELARRLKRLWRPREPGDGGWMNNR